MSYGPPGLEKRQYTDKVDYKGSLFLHVQEMTREAARDGYMDEYEDMVDSLIDYLWPYILIAELKEKVEKLEARGEGLIRTKDKEEWEKAKRYRIRHKTRLCFELMHRNKLLLKYVPEYDTELDQDKIPVKV